jgi:ABC-type sulfate transport system substrate-binding protein
MSHNDLRPESLTDPYTDSHATSRRRLLGAGAGALALLAQLPLASPARGQGRDIQLLNVSYDPTRELYVEFNKAFAAHWKGRSGDNVTVRQSHGGSGRQARSVIDGLDADVVTLALAYDIDELYAKAQLIPADWQKRLPHNSSPYTSTIVFLVRKGFGNNAARAESFVADLYRNVPVLDSGARGSLTTLAERNVGDVFLSWENEAFLAVKELGPTRFDIVVPSLSILAEPPVTVVDRNVDRKGTRAVAQAYLEFLYTPQGQSIAADNYYRPRDPQVAAKFASTFTNKVNLFTIDEVFGGWSKAQPQHFNDGGVFDRIFTRK